MCSSPNPLQTHIAAIIGVFMRLEGRYICLGLMLTLSFKLSDKKIEQNVVAYGRQSRLQMGR